MYYGNWSDKQGIENDFDVSLNENVVILLAAYNTPWYEGYGFVLFEENGMLYEVNASHCSCHGLEGQWVPEETSVEALIHRLNEGVIFSYFDESGALETELREILKRREAQ